MVEKSAFQERRTGIQRGIVTGAVIGGILGGVAGFLDEIGVWDMPFNTALTGAILGILIGGGIGSLIGLRNSRGIASGDSPAKMETEIPDPVHTDAVSGTKLQVREEQLDISRKLVKTADVTMHREVCTEEKNIIVPVTREELVIEKKVLDPEDPDHVEAHTETIRIPIHEERIEVIKHPVVLEDVIVYKNQFVEMETVEETLKKEKVHVETTGNVEVIEKETEKHP
jgi:uncharacterized protein (TIGR02271 family)